MGIGEEIKQSKFRSEFHKSIINLHFTASWLGEKQHGFFKSFGITAAQFNVLRILRGQHPKPSTINLIIERMIDRMSNASRIVDKLERKGLVARTQCANDRRAVDVVITESGLELLRQMDEKMNEWEGKYRHINEQEAEQLNLLLDKFRGG